MTNMSIAHLLFQAFIRITGITVCNRQWTSSLDQGTQTKWLIQFPQLSLMVYTEQERADSIGEKQNQAVWGDSLRISYHSLQLSCSEGQRFPAYPYHLLTAQLGIKDQMKQTLWTHLILLCKIMMLLEGMTPHRGCLRTAAPTFLIPGTDFTEDDFPTDWGVGALFQDFKCVIFIAHLNSHLMLPLTWQEVRVCSLETSPLRRPYQIPLTEMSMVLWQMVFLVATISIKLTLVECRDILGVFVQWLHLNPFGNSWLFKGVSTLTSVWNTLNFK